MKVKEGGEKVLYDKSRGLSSLGGLKNRRGDRPINSQKRGTGMSRKERESAVGKGQPGS